MRFILALETYRDDKWVWDPPVGRRTFPPVLRMIEEHWERYDGRIDLKVINDNDGKEIIRIVTSRGGAGWTAFLGKRVGQRA